MTSLFVQFAQIQEITQTAEAIEAQWGWSQMLWVALIGFVLVVVLLFALVGVMKVFGACFSQKPAANADKSAPSPSDRKSVV